MTPSERDGSGIVRHGLKQFGAEADGSHVWQVPDDVEEVDLR